MAKTVSDKLTSCMSKAKNRSERVACKKQFAKEVPRSKNIFHNITKYQQSKQDSASFPGYDKDNIFYRPPDLYPSKKKKKKK
tara:strand:+ start:94 stop:339 length:246 start_codon:yes stop_codon:yes gene_type:complete